MKRVAIYFILFFTGYVQSGVAQEKANGDKCSVSGMVLSEKNQPMEFVNVALLTRDSVFIQGQCTGVGGTFRFETVTPGSYLLQLSYMGYRTVFVPCNSGETVRHMLVPESVVLSETVVTANRPVYKLQNGTLETKVSHSLLATLSNAEDVLKHIPGMRLSEDGYTVFGKGTPVFYLNNRRLQDTSELERLSAADIERVELITNPGAEYDATVKSVVRIYTLKKESGVSTVLRAGVICGRRTTHYEELSMNSHRGGLSLSGMLYYNHDSSKRSQVTQYEIPSPSGMRLIKSSSNFTGNGQLLGASTSVSYDFSTKHSSGFSYEYSRIPSFQNDGASSYTVKSNSVLTDQTAYLSNIFQQSSDHRFNLYYQGIIGKLHLDFSGDIVRSNNYNRQDVEENSRKEGTREINSFSRADNSLYAAKLIASYSLGRGDVKAGADYTSIRRKDKFANPQELLPTTDSRINESKLAVFAEYSRTFGKVNAVAGLRLEHASSRYWEKKVYMPGQSRIYNDWCPNVSVNFPLGHIQTSVSYTVKTNRPSFQLLRSSVNYNNRFVYEGGNPMLTPETNHDLQLSTLYGWVQFTLGYQYVHNAIGFMAKGYEGNPDIAVFTFGNFRKSESINASLVLSPTIGVWKPELGIYFTRPYFKTIALNGPKRMYKRNLYISWNNTFQLCEGVILSVNADYQNEGNVGASLQRSYWGMDMGLSKSFLRKRLSVNLDYTDLWNTRRNSFMLFGEKLTYTKWNRPDSRKLSLKVSYSINNTKKNYKGTHAAEEDIKRL